MGALSRGWAERATNSSGSGREPQLATVWHAPQRPWCAAVETAAAARGATRLSVCENPFATGIYLYGAHHPHDSIYGYEVTKVGKRRLGSGGERRRGTNYGRGTTV